MESMYLDSSRCLKIYWDNPKYVWRVQDVFNMSSTYLQTVQNLYGQYVSGQFKVLPDSPKSVLKCIIYFCERGLRTFFGWSREMIIHSLGMSRKIFMFFSSGRFLSATRKILGFQASGFHLSNSRLSAFEAAANRICADQFVAILVIFATLG